MSEISLRQFRINGKLRYEVMKNGRLKGEFADYKDAERLIEILRDKPKDRKDVTYDED